ncbi:hypothetical protein [Brucella anthropi]|uniref:hypothetical protein n=1 Tax=Brucella anthropi TaxID=529 RepID=UPI000F664085|nr:hypothetical protein [Brucella anthropi]RRY09024.1 hypothetical protein EGJ58_14205 [Brucella anthropi]
MMSVLSKPVALTIVLVALLASAALGIWGTVSGVRTIIADQVVSAISARDSHWSAEIEKANAIAAQNIIAQMRAAQAADLAARTEITRLKTELSELESKNANLPDRDGSGIDVERTRLLNKQPIANYPH